MNKKYILIIIVLIAVIMGVSILSGNGNTGVEIKPEKFDTMPPFSLKDYDGNIVSSDNLDSKILIVNSWAVWCPFCRNELSDFAELQEEFGDIISVIAIDRAEPLELAKEFTDSIGATDRMTFLLDPRDSFYQSIGGFSMPETIFIDEDRNIRLHKRGPMDLDEMKKHVEDILNN